MITRRRFLGRSGVAAAAASAIGFPHVARSADALPNRPGQKPRHIIHMVADGMSMGTLTCGDYLSHLERGRGLTWVGLCNHPAVHTGWMNMRSLNSMVTDSSAASSSWGSGSRIMNGMVNQLPDGTNLKTIYELFAEAGWKRGLVTTTEITHATPAGFAANSDDREKGSLIAEQYIQRKVDILLGGGQKFFDPKQRRDRKDLYAAARREGYHVMMTLKELLAAPTNRRWLGTFDKSHLPWTLDHLRDPAKLATVPTLATMTHAALKWLESAPNFILQVEGGRVDQACHNCDAAAAFHDQIAFDQAIDVCLDFQKKVPDTLIVITTDHGNGNPGLNGTGTAYGQSSYLFANLKKVKRSFPEMLKLMRRTEKAKPATVAGGGQNDNDNDDEGADTASKETSATKSAREVAEIIRDSTGFEVSERRTEMLLPFIAKKGKCIYDAMNSDVAQLGQILGNHLGVGWTSNAHTADFVPVLAIGPGSEHFRGFIENTSVFRHYTGMAGIDFRNPEEPIIAGGPDAGAVENVAEYQMA